MRFPYRNEVGLLILGIAVIQFFPGGTPLSVYVGGTVAAAPLLLSAIGIILVYRANRFINFSQLQLSIWTGILFQSLVRGEGPLRGLRTVCGCISQTPGSTATAINFAFSALVSIAAAILINYFVSLVLIRHFARSGQLVLTLVTIAVAQALAGTQTEILQELIPTHLLSLGLLPQTAPSPVDVTVKIGGYPLHLADLLFVGVAVVGVVALSTYLRRSGTGAGIRAAAENPSRALSLGLAVDSVTATVWGLAGLFAGVAGVLGAFNGAASASSSSTFALDVEGFTVILVVVVLARFTSIWLAAGAAVVVGILQAAVQQSYFSEAPFDAALVLIIGGILMLQREPRGRSDRDDFAENDLIRELRPMPFQLKSHDVVRSWVRTGSVVGAAVLIGLPFALGAGSVALLSDYVAFALIGLSILILSGWAGQAALGQFGFAAVGAWAGAVCGLPFLAALVIGGLAGAAAAVVIGIPGLKLKGLSLAICTMAFSVSAYTLFINTTYFGSLLPSSLAAPSVFGLNISSPISYYFFCLVVLILCLVGLIGLRRSRTARVLIALRANEPAAQSFGINPQRARLSAYAVSGLLSGVAGVLVAYRLGVVAPATFAPAQSIYLFVLTAIGGLGAMPGPVIGFAFGWILVSLSSNPLITYFGEGIGLLLLLYVLPGGLAQGVYDIRDSMLRRLAIRRRIDVPSLLGARSGDAGDTAFSIEPPRRGPSAEAQIRYKLSGQWALGEEEPTAGVAAGVNTDA